MRTLASFAILLIPALVTAQPPAAPAPPPAAPPVPDSVLVTVNGHPIMKSTVDRAIKRFPAEQQEKARAEVIEYLIDTAVVDQYLGLMKVTVEEKEMTARIEEIRKELSKSGQTIEKLLQGLSMTEAEFRSQLGNDLRWEKFALQQATDAVLKGLFERSPDMFDGSSVRARHILLSPPAGDDKAAAAAIADLTQYRKLVETRAAEAVAKLPPTADAAAREQERTKAIDDTFSALAKEKSVCPSKRDGGDLNFFPRIGSLVEPFARAAFALKPWEMSQPVKTQFGYHLILVTARNAGKARPFEEVKEEVREVYCNQLRDAICAKYRPEAKIVHAK